MSRKPPCDNFGKFRTHGELLKQLRDVGRKIKNLAEGDLGDGEGYLKNIDFLEQYVTRSTNHGQATAERLIGTGKKDLIRLGLHGPSFREQESLIVVYNQGVEDYNKQLELSSSIPVDKNLKQLEHDLTRKYNEIRTAFRDSQRYSNSSPLHDSWPRETFEICQKCGLRIKSKYKTRDMTAEEHAVEQDTVRKAKEAYVPYDCTSSFCGYGNSCNRCDANYREPIRAGTEMTWNEYTCLCGTVSSPERSNGSH